MTCLCFCFDPSKTLPPHVSEKVKKRQVISNLILTLWSIWYPPNFYSETKVDVSPEAQRVCVFSVLHIMSEETRRLAGYTAQIHVGKPAFQMPGCLWGDWRATGPHTVLSSMPEGGGFRRAFENALRKSWESLPKSFEVFIIHGSAGGQLPPSNSCLGF